MSFSVSGQGNVLELLPGAEKLGYNKKLGYQYLIHGVNFIYQGNTMYCDSAHYYDKTQEVRAYGNVQVKKDDINLFCDSLYYNGKTKKAKLWGHVRVRDLEYKLTTDTLEYDAKKGQGLYRHGGKIESIVSTEVLTSRVGYFYPDSKSFFFSGKVKYRNEELSMTTDTLQYVYSKQTTYFYGPTKIVKDSTTMHCERGWYNVETEEGSLIRNARIDQGNRIIKGDTLLYQPALGQYIGKGHVYLKDTTERTEFYGDRAFSSDQKNFSYITGHALAVRAQKNDTIYIHADTLFNQNDTLGKPLYSRAHYNVKIFNADVQAMCDSMHFSDPNGTMELFKGPIVWAKNAELKGDKMDIFLNDSVVERIVITENATALMEIDSGQYYNQIGGKLMTAYFKENELVRSVVNGGAKTIFFPENEEKTDTTVTVKRLGMNRLYASDLRIYLDSGEVTGITYYDKPDGVFYPMDQIKEDEQFIKEFEWKAALRPKDWTETIHQ
jgi:lipopolysaccharide export system protein LptA